MKIYTKTGDKGITGIIGGKRVLKNDLKIEAYGTIDELNSFLGLLRCKNIDLNSKNSLLKIQNFLFEIGAVLASETMNISQQVNTDFEQNTLFLESQINTIDNCLPELKAFIIPGSNEVEATCQIARTICRRAERNIVSLMSQNNDVEVIVKYINRLSDYLFILSRKFSIDFNDVEIIVS